MKKARKYISFLLALCMVFSLSVAAFAAEENCTGHIDWSLDGGTLHISGHGKIVPFASAEDQPWAEVREEITQVHLDPSAHMQIPDAAFWFAGCTNLEVCQLPSFTDLGTDTFKDCAKLEILMLYYHDEAFQIADSAFSGVDIDALVVLTDDIVTQTALEQRGFTVVSAYDSDLLAGNCGITGCNCSSCSYTYSYEPKDASRHYIWECCTKCSANEYAYRHTGSHSFNSRGVCTLCGYAEEVSCSHTSTRTTWNGCNWTKICNNCGETVDWGTSHGSYSYGAWQYYNTSQHRRYGTCNDCGGGGKYEYGSHSTTNRYTSLGDSQHSVSKYCSICGSDVGSSSTQNHSLSYGSWTKYSDSQHSRTKSCAACGYSGTEYGDHVDGNKDGKCDTCGYTMGVTVTWDAGTNGGTVNGGNMVTTTAPLNTTAAAPSYTPTKIGHTFTNWYTSATGGSLYSTVTISEARTFYAQFAPKQYTITWDLGGGRTETSEQTFGEALVLPEETPTNGNYAFDGWFTEAEGGAEVDENTVFSEPSDTTYYAHWLEYFSVTVPTVLPLSVDEAGEVYTTDVEIANHSSGNVKVSSVKLTGTNGWQIVPYKTNMAGEKVDAKLVGLRLNSVETTLSGDSETLAIGESWRILKDGGLPLQYDAAISALSQPVTNETILTAVFVVEWA